MIFKLNPLSKNTHTSSYNTVIEGLKLVAGASLRFTRLSNELRRSEFMAFSHWFRKVRCYFITGNKCFK